MNNFVKNAKFCSFSLEKIFLRFFWRWEGFIDRPDPSPLLRPLRLNVVFICTHFKVMGSRFTRKIFFNTPSFSRQSWMKNWWNTWNDCRSSNSQIRPPKIICKKRSATPISFRWSTPPALSQWNASMRRRVVFCARTK